MTQCLSRYGYHEFIENLKPLLEGSVSTMQKDIAFENECNIKKKRKTL